MMNTRPADPTFREGDEVVLATGTYQGTLGVFLRLEKDVNWADIMRAQRRHPQPPGDLAGAFRQRNSRFRELTPP